MIYTPLTKIALKICFEAHKNQVDKSGLPYVFHPFHLAEQMNDEKTVVVALLHDVLEDSDTSEDDLKKYRFGDDVIEALRLLTHNPEEDYFVYINRIKSNHIAKTVKLADLKHNSDLSRLDSVKQKDVSRAEKYQKAMRLLCD